MSWFAIVDFDQSRNVCFYEHHKNNCKPFKFEVGFQKPNLKLNSEGVKAEALEFALF